MSGRRKGKKEGGRSLSLLYFNTVSIKVLVYQCQGFPGGSAVKNPPSSVGDMDSIPGLGRSPGE